MAVDRKHRKGTDEKPAGEELIEDLLAGYNQPQDIESEGILRNRLAREKLQRAVNADLTNHAD
jgi:hypothetical protein